MTNGYGSPYLFIILFCVFSCRLLAEQAEQSAEEHQRRLTKKSGELQATEERNLRLEDRIGEKEDGCILFDEEFVIKLDS